MGGGGVLHRHYGKLRVVAGYQSTERVSILAGDLILRKDILQMFYTATINSVLIFAMTFWGGNAS